MMTIALKKVTTEMAEGRGMGEGVNDFLRIRRDPGAAGLYAGSIGTILSDIVIAWYAELTKFDAFTLLAASTLFK